MTFTWFPHFTLLLGSSSEVGKSRVEIISDPMCAAGTGRKAGGCEQGQVQIGTNVYLWAHPRAVYPLMMMMMVGRRRRRGRKGQRKRREEEEEAVDCHAC